MNTNSKNDTCDKLKNFQCQLKNINKEIIKSNTTDIYSLGNKLNIFIHQCVDFIATFNKKQ